MQGVCSFAEKAWQAEQAGALGVLIYDSDRTNDHRWIDMVRDGEAYEVTIPTLFMLGREGFKIAGVGVQQHANPSLYFVRRY